MTVKRMQQRRGTAAEWTTANPTLLAGEHGYESDTHKFKIGDGSSTWTALGYSTMLPADITAAIAAGAGDEYHEYANLAGFPVTGVTDRIYVAVDSGLLYRWTGSTYAMIGGGTLDPELSAIAGLTSAANKGIQFTGSGTAATFDLTTAGKALLDDPDAATQRATLGATAQWVVGVGNGSTNDRAAFVTADGAAQSANIPVLIPAGTYRIATSLTITSPVIFQPGAKIKPDSGATVTLAGGLTAPNSQIFDHSASGLVVPKNVDFYRPCWWGAVNTANDSAVWVAMAAALQASAATFSSVGFGQRVLAPQGVNRIIGVTLANCEIDAGRGVSCFLPPTATTTGVMLTLGDYSQLNGGWFGTDQPGQAVKCVYQQGYRSQVDGTYIANTAENSVGLQMGLSGAGSTTPVANNVRINSGQATPAAGAIGLDIQSSDSELTNVWVAQHDIGIKGTLAGSCRLANVHVWGNNAGITGDNWDDSQMSNVYLDSNRGWGMDVDKMDRCLVDGIYAWNNGFAIGSTGGIRVQQSAGSAQFSIFRGVFLDDNVGTGLKVIGTQDYEFDVILSSASVQSGGAVITATGVDIDSGALRSRLGLRGTGATTPVSDASATTVYTAFTGTLLDLTSAQTPTNKTLSGLTNTITGVSGELPPVRAVAQAVTYTIASGSVTQIAGTTVDGVSPAIGDRIAIVGAPAASGAGSSYSTQTGNGIYRVTGNTTNLTVVRAADHSGSNSPWGTSVKVREGSTWGGHMLHWEGSGAFTWGSNALAGYSYRFGPANGVDLTTAQTLFSKTLSNPTITNYTESVEPIGNSGSTQTLALNNGTVQTCTLTGNCTFTMPTPTAGKSFTLLLKTGTGGFTATFTGVKWINGTAPTVTVTAARLDLFTFIADGTNWYGSPAQNYTP